MTADDESKTLYVKIEPGEEHEQRVQERLERIDDRKREPFDETHVLSFTDFKYLSRVLSETNLTLIQAIAEHEPESIRETARFVERDVSDVHRNLTELETLGIIEFEENGKAKRPTVFYDEIEITLSLPVSDEDDPSQVIA